MSRYAYSPLHGPSEIRVLKLLPGEGESPLRCHISHVELNQEPRYEALSYTWGSSKSCYPLDTGEGHLHITKHLTAALLALRLQSSTRVIWIDAVCINQNDLSERSEQVTIMFEIYSCASSVLIWLGESANNSDLVMDFLSTTDIPEEMYDPRYYAHIPSDQHAPKLSSLLSETLFVGTSPHAQAAEALFCRPWFKRVWVQQEAAANEQSIVMCGTKTVPLKKLFGLVIIMNRQSLYGLGVVMSSKALSSLDCVMTIQECQDAHRRRYNLAPMTLLELLRTTQLCQASDSRDKIYAMFNLVPLSEKTKVGLTVDYRQETSAVYSFVTSCFLGWGSVRLLNQAGTSNQSEPGLPSWAVDWSGKGRKPFHTQQSELKSPARPNLRTTLGSTKHMLVVEAVCFSELLEVSGGLDIQSRPDKAACFSADFKALRDLMTKCMALATKVVSSGQEDVDLGRLAAVLMTGLTDNDSPSPGDQLKILLEELFSSEPQTHTIQAFDRIAAFLTSPALFESSMWNEEDMKKQAYDEASINAPRWWYLLYRMRAHGVFYSQQIGVDAAGRLWLVPREAQPQDAIAFICGFNHPVIIRQSGNGCHKLIGTGFVHENLTETVLTTEPCCSLIRKNQVLSTATENLIANQSGKASTLPLTPPGWTVRFDETLDRLVWHHGAANVRTIFDPSSEWLGCGPCPKPWRAIRGFLGEDPLLANDIHFINDDTEEVTKVDPYTSNPISETAHNEHILLI